MVQVTFTSSTTPISTTNKPFFFFIFFFWKSCCSLQHNTQVMEMDTELGTAPESLFRPVKRRKFLRRRPDHEREDAQDNAQGVNDENSRNFQDSADNTQQETDDVVRLRRPQRTRKGGIEFSTTSRQTTNNSQSVTPTQTEEAEDDTVLAMCDRFTAHTGQTVDVDKHMYNPLPPGVLALVFCLSQWRLTR